MSKMALCPAWAGLHRFNLAHAGRTHSKKNEYKPHLKKRWCIPAGAQRSLRCGHGGRD